MAQRPIIKLPNSRNATRPTGSPRNIPRPGGPGRGRQGQRFEPTFNRLTEALSRDNADVALRSDPAGIAPDRALVFVTAGPIQNFIKAAERVGLSVIYEMEFETDISDEFQPAGDDGKFSPVLYATMPTLPSIQQLLTLWAAYKRGDDLPIGTTPWRDVFDLLVEIRVWGPEDRLPESSRELIEENLPFDETDPVKLELEIFPIRDETIRNDWVSVARDRVNQLTGTVIDTCSIVDDGFIYEALLIELSVGAVRQMLNDPYNVNGLATVEGIQLILPQTIAQAPKSTEDEDNSEIRNQAEINPALPLRCALLDGMVVAAHPTLEDGVAIEDLNELERFSQVANRDHATTMASLILRGDLGADGEPLTDSRILNVPVLIDAESSTISPENRLFIDVIHSTLIRLFSPEIAIDHNIFVINFSIGISNLRYSGRISALARLLDWWSFTHGVLFVISAGNIPDDLIIPNMKISEFESLTEDEKKKLIREAIRNSAFNRTLLAPAESLNGLTVGALSEDLSADSRDTQNTYSLTGQEGTVTAISSALGPGKMRSIKPDLVTVGGRHEYSIFPNGEDLRFILRRTSAINGLVAASSRQILSSGVCRTRGTSCATALATRNILQAAVELTKEGGPFQGEELPRQDNALLSRALAVNSAFWSDDAKALYDEEKETHNSHWFRSEEQVTKFYGFGTLSPGMMQECTQHNAILVGLGTINKDEAKVFDLPLPHSLSGEKIGRRFRVTIAWFSPIDSVGSRYKMASLEAFCGDELDSDDKEWGMGLKSDRISEKIFSRGSVWSKRLLHKRIATPEYDEDYSIPIRVQCRDTANGRLNPDIDIRFALVVSLEVENSAQFDIHEEISQSIRIKAQQN